LRAADNELVGIARVIDGAGVLQVVSDFADLDAEFSLMRAMVDASGCPLSISVAAEDHRAPWSALRDRIAAAASDGLPMRGQVGARAIGVLLGLQTTLNPFLGAPSYREVAGLPFAEKVAALAEPGRRAALLAEVTRGNALAGFDRIFELTDPPDYEPAPSDSLAARAARLGVEPAALALDLLLADDGNGLLYLPFHNWVDGSLGAIGAMLADPHLVPGLSDGGAHVGTICDASYPTTLLAHWTRDRAHGLPLEWIVSRQCRATAEAVGLLDRGIIAPGMRADLNVIDHASVRARRPYLAYDLPAHGRRLLQRAEGYVHTLVGGVETYANGEATGALPGRLVRGRQMSW
jgi:N-acyl-D-aspartate/D-glutamate deacylase